MLCPGKTSLLKDIPVAAGKILSQRMNLVLLLLKSQDLLMFTGMPEETGFQMVSTKRAAKS